MTVGCCVCGLAAADPSVTVFTDRGEETFCVPCRFPAEPDGGFDHDGLEGYDPAVVALADRLLAMSTEILAETAARKTWSATREDWVAVQQLENAGNSVYSAQCWVLRAEGERVSRRRAASPVGEELE